MLASEWPLSIKTRIDIEVQRLTDELSSSEIETISKNMHIVKQMAGEAKSAGNKQNACMLWNPRKRAVIAAAADRTQSDDRSIDHCSMVILQECASLLTATDDSHLGKHSFEEDAYLCANTHLFVYEEPCSLS